MPKRILYVGCLVPSSLEGKSASRQLPLNAGEVEIVRRLSEAIPDFLGSTTLPESGTYPQYSGCFHLPTAAHGLPFGPRRSYQQHVLIVAEDLRNHTADDHRQRRP